MRSGSAHQASVRMVLPNPPFRSGTSIEDMQSPEGNLRDVRGKSQDIASAPLVSSSLGMRHHDYMRAALCFGLLAALSGTAADWIRLRTPEIELLSDAGERPSRDTLTRLT